MRLDHIAYRVADRHQAVEFFMKAFDYSIADEFKINFNNGEKAECFALTPPEVNQCDSYGPWCVREMNTSRYLKCMNQTLPINPSRHELDYHLPPEIFVSDGSENSVVGKWVKARGGVGGIHHLAYEVDDVYETMREWKKKKFAEFTTEYPIAYNAGGLIQCFTKPHPVTGVVYEFIKRGKDNKGFNINNVRDLMESTDE